MSHYSNGANMIAALRVVGDMDIVYPTTSLRLAAPTTNIIKIQHPTRRDGKRIL